MLLLPGLLLPGLLLPVLLLPVLLLPVLLLPGLLLPGLLLPLSRRGPSVKADSSPRYTLNERDRLVADGAAAALKIAPTSCENLLAVIVARALTSRKLDPMKSW